MNSIKPSQRLEILSSTGLRLLLELPAHYRLLSEDHVTSLVYDLMPTMGNSSRRLIPISPNQLSGITPDWESCTVKVLSRVGSLWTLTMRLHWKFRIQKQASPKRLSYLENHSIVN